MQVSDIAAGRCPRSATLLPGCCSSLGVVRCIVGHMNNVLMSISYTFSLAGRHS
jgi:hypothetical protein